MDFVPLSPALGADVRGVDVARAPSRADRDALLEAFDRFHLLRFAAQSCSGPEQERLAAMFGPLIDEMRDGHVSGFISNVRPDAAGSGPLPFHSDLSFTTSPVVGICLYAIELPVAGTSTWFANARRVWQTLPTELRTQIEGHAITHALGAIETGRTDAKSRDHRLGADAPRATHPIPLLHPRTGVPLLYLTDLHAERIEGLPRPESDALLDTLLSHLYAPEHVYEHRWAPGDLLIWDNYALQHARGDVTEAKPRTFRRVSLNTARYVDLVPLGPLG